MFGITKKQLNNTVGLRSSGNTTNAHVRTQGYEPLGTSGDKCVIYSNTLNKIVELSPRDVVDPSKLAMCVGLGYVCNQLNITDSEFFSKGRNFGMTMIEECQHKGPISAIKARGRGFWMSNDGVLLVNSIKLTDTDGNEFSRRQGEYVYTSEGDLGFYPDTIAATEIEGRAVFDMFHSFSFKNKEAAALILSGFTVAALFPGVLPWRPSVFLKGRSGSGKSTLTKTVHELLGTKRSYRFTAKTTSTAGIIQMLGNDAVTCILDEMEGSSSTSKLLEYNRNVSEGITGVKGTSHGTAMTADGRTCFLFGAINPPKMDDADANRLLMVEMNELRRDNREKHFLIYDEFNQESKKTLQRIGQGLSMRALKRVDEMISTAYRIKEAMYDMGYSDRICDTYSPAIAGAWILLNDAEMTDSDISSYISKFNIAKETEAVSLANNLYQSIFNTAIKTDTCTTTLNFLIHDYIKSIKEKNHVLKDTSEYTLALYGIRLSIDDSKLTMLIKGKNNESLIKLMGGDKAIDIDGILMQMPGAFKLDKTVRIGGVTTRAISIPLNIDDYYTSEKEQESKEVTVLNSVRDEVKKMFSEVGMDLDFETNKLV